MFLLLDWSPPVLNSIDWTWFGKAHTCPYKVPQLTVHVRAKTKPRGQRNCSQSSETGLCRGTDLGKDTKTFLQHWRFPRTQWPPSFLNGRSLELPRLFLELAVQQKMRNRDPMVTLQSSRAPLWRWENLPEEQTSLQQSNNQVFMAEWPGGSHSTVKGTCQSAWSLTKGS